MSTTVRDVMTSEVVSVNPDTPFKEIARYMVSQDISAVPVVEDNQVVGIVSETDMLHKEEYKPQTRDEDYQSPLRARIRRKLGSAGSAREKAEAEKARQLMSRKVATARPEDSAVTAARIMDRHDVKQLPVVDEKGRLVGLVGRRDLLRVFVRPDEDIARDVGAAIAQAPAWLNTDRLKFAVDEGTVTLEGRLEQHSNCTVLNQLVHGIDGVVGVNSKLTWEVDDLLPPRQGWVP